MKKYNSVSYKWFWGIALPILLFFASMNVAYAYFTASTSNEASFTTGTISINLSNMNYTSPQSLTFSSTMTDLEPGDTVTLTGKISNTGNIPLYYVLEYTITVATADKSVTFDFVHSYITGSSDGTSTTISANTQDAKLLGNTYNTFDNFTISHQVPADSVGISYSGGSVTISLVAHAIQYANIASANAALKLLLPSL